ncbi:SAF domain-containing protein [Microbacterium sp. P06]|uniref:SAF domain-containing protein n=1 Tax=Microbacterium sp. P06 TaxID=3366949 RepID=UPI00374553A4
MTAIDSPRRRPRKFWGDARFLLGILLIALSVAGVWLVVTAARQTAPVYAATRTIVPGETLTVADLRVVDVALGQVGESYVGPAALEDGTVATRTIGEGELVPAEAVGAAADARTTSLVIRTSSDVSASIVEGTRVEVWHAPPLDREAFDAPRILVADATVAAVTRDDAMIGGANATLEVVIARADVAATLEAQSNGSVLSVVPVAGTAR